MRTGVKRARNGLQRRSRRALNRSLARLDGGDGGDRPLPTRPILIVGAPRSGSTLLQQLLVEAFDFCYLSNLHCTFYGSPALVQRVAGRWLAPPGDFSSAHGRTEGPGGPAECGDYWYRFFRRRPQYVPLAEADPERLRALRASVRALAAAARRPVVFKNLICTLRLEPIAAALPEALFLVVRRDLVDNAASLLLARRAVHGDERRWWSAEPPGFDELLARPAHEQVVEQVLRIEALVDAERERLGTGRFLDLDYATVCASPADTVHEIETFAAGAGLRLARRAGRIPPSFERPPAAELEPEALERIAGYARSAAGSP
jgi:Sulfotransferase family